MSIIVPVGQLLSRNNYIVTCCDRWGRFKWEEPIKNIVVEQGVNDFLDKYFKGSGYTAAHYVGLKGTGTAVDGDTMASHASWSELTDYDEATRPIITLGSVASKAVDNSSSRAVFTISATIDIAGILISTDNTKGGTSGVLFGAADFASSRPAVDDDTLSVLVQFTGASA